MARPECVNSLKLAKSMNNQCRLMTIEDLHLHRKAIDVKDDKRREKSFNLDKQNEDMQKHFSRERKKLLELEDLNEMRTGLRELDKKEDRFNARHSLSKKEIREIELYYEDLDDEIAVEILVYIAKCMELNKDENFGINLKMIEENLEKKKSKKIEN